MSVQALYAQHGLTRETFPAPSAGSVFQRNATNDGWDAVSVADLLAAADGTVAFTGVVFTGFAAPVAPSSPATKQYVDDLVAGYMPAHGNQLGGSLHALASDVAAGFMSPAQYLQLAGLPPVTSDSVDTADATLTAIGDAAYVAPAGRVTLLAVVTAKEKLTNAWGASFIYVAHYTSDGMTTSVQGENDPTYLLSYDGGQGVIAKFNVTGNTVSAAVVSNSDQVHWTAKLFAFPA